jgi:hypothetical protein
MLRRLAVIALLLLLIFGSGFLVGILLPKWAGTRPAPKAYNTAVVLTQVQTLSELVTVKYVMEKVQVLVDPPSGLRSLFPDNTKVILIAHGVVKAGLELNRIKPEDIKISGKKIIVRLPPARITDVYLDEKQTQVLEHDTGFLRPFNKDLEQVARQNAVDDIGRAARQEGILKDAEERARGQLTSLFHQLGFDQIEFRGR